MHKFYSLLVCVRNWELKRKKVAKFLITFDGPLMESSTEMVQRHFKFHTLITHFRCRIKSTDAPAKDNSLRLCTHEHSCKLKMPEQQKRRRQIQIARNLHCTYKSYFNA